MNRLRLFFCTMLILSATGLQIRAQNTLTVAGQMTVSPNTDITVLGDFENRQVIQNSGKFFISGNGINQFNAMFSGTGSVAVGGNWTNSQSFNSATFILNGSQDQNINNNGQGFDSLVIDGGGNKFFEGDVDVSAFLVLQNGLVNVNNGRVFIQESADVSDGSDLSYVVGQLTRAGTGFRNFPIGKNGVFAPIILEDAQGIDPVITMEMFQPNNNSPAPDTSLIGVSAVRYWELTLESGSFDGSTVVLSTVDEDLNNLPVRNNINVRVTKPVVAQAADAPGGPFTSLGNAFQSGDLRDGEIASELPGVGRFFAVALAPEVPEEGVLFIPDAFSPSSDVPENQTFRVFGERISPEGFSFRVFDKWGLVVFETEDFVEANTVGWNGRKDNTGDELKVGVYSYTVVGQFTTGERIDELGTVILIR